jgi:hypothetical protein
MFLTESFLMKVAEALAATNVNSWVARQSVWVIQHEHRFSGKPEFSTA